MGWKAMEDVADQNGNVDAEIDHPASSETVQGPQVALAILQAVRTAQNQHGLRHSDHKRYSAYCSRKLHRLYKTHKLTHGRAKFTRRQLEAHSIRDGGQLLIPLFCAERAWSVAMNIKAQLDKNQRHKSYKHLHAVRRLAKAARHAKELSSLAEQAGDPCTAVEAEAYASYMAGVWLSEKGSDWPAALGKLQRSQRLCEALAQAGPLEQQLLYRQQLEELEPLIRFGQYEQGKAGASAAPGADDPSLSQHLQTHLQALTEHPSDAPAASQAGLSTFTWRGRGFPVQSERVRHTLGPALHAPPGGTDEQLAALNEAKGLIRGALKASQGASAEALEDLKALDMAVSGASLEATIARGQRLAVQAGQRWAQTHQSSVPAKDAAKPRDVVRHYDSLLGSVRELRAAAANLGGSAGELLLDACTAATAQYQAHRCFYVAQAHREAGSPQAAYGLLSRAQQRADEAVAAHHECASVDQEAVQALQQLREQAGSWQCVAQAEAAAADAAATDAADQGLRDLSVSQQAPAAASEYLLDNLQTWEDFTQPPRLFAIPPKPSLMAMRPFLLDTAQKFVAPASLEHRTAAKQKPGMVASLFGWK